MAMINGDTEQALGILVKANEEAADIKRQLCEVGISSFDGLDVIANEEGKLEDSLRSKIKSFKVKYSVELTEIIKNV